MLRRTEARHHIYLFLPSSPKTEVLFLPGSFASTPVEHAASDLLSFLPSEEDVVGT
jgi:hypothetical protein